MTDHSKEFGAALIAGIEKTMAARSVREIKSTAEDGSPLRVFYDGPSLVADYHGQTLPLLGLPEKAQEEIYREAGAGWTVTGVGEVTGIALGDSRIDEPGFPDAKLVGQLQVGEEGEKLSPYLDPKRNPFIRLDDDDKVPEPTAKPIKAEKGLDPYLNPAVNKFIKLD